MMLYDLSHILNNASPVYPGTSRPRFEQAATIDQSGYREKHLQFNSHLGTHIDAPAHLLGKGATLDKLPLETFTGKALIVSVPEKSNHIEKERLIPFEKELEEVDFMLFKTGWSKLWGTSGYFKDFPVLSADAADWLLQFSLRGIGFDTVSADPVEDTSYPNHFRILSHGMIIIENLKFPQELNNTKGDFSCFPLPLEDADGSPVRAIFRT
jgi:arylformamidase